MSCFVLLTVQNPKTLLMNFLLGSYLINRLIVADLVKNRVAQSFVSIKYKALTIIIPIMPLSSVFHSVTMYVSYCKCHVLTMRKVEFSYDMTAHVVCIYVPIHLSHL